MATVFEIHVEGQLGEPTLHTLGCAHSLTEAQTMLRIDATPTDLHRFLEACSDRSLTIESVVRIDPA